MTCKLLWKDERGADVIEYALLVCMAALVCVASFAPLAEATAKTGNRIAEMMATASGAVKPVRSASASAPTRAQASPPAAYATSGHQQEYPIYLEETGAVYVVYGGRVYIGQARGKAEALRLAGEWLKDK
jgi:Flp pilus assembly pilin Flp